MTHLRTSKFWLLTTAALMFGSQMPAHAQVSIASASTYQYGTPTMVAAAPSLPSVRAEQIAQDVTSEFNPRTGRTELAAAPFDPFEDDPSLAGSLQLRSADGSVSVDGQSLQGGAIVDVDFYYNSPSDDPYGGRNYGDASFVNGQLAPVVTRDTRILECSTRVDNVVYDHSNYYSRSPHIGIYRPYRHYAGHSGFGFGYGSNYFGPGFNYYNRNRGNFHHARRGSFTRLLGGLRRDSDDRYSDDRYRDGDRDRYRDRDGDRDRVRVRDGDRVRDRDRDRRDRDGDRRDDRADTGTTPRTRPRDTTDQQRENRLRAMQLHGSALPWSGATRRNGRSTLRSSAPRERIVIEPISPQTQTQSRAPTAVPRVSQSDAKSPERRSQRRRFSTPQRQESRNTVRRAPTINRAGRSVGEVNRRTTPPQSQAPRVQAPRVQAPRATRPSSRPSRPAASRSSTPKDSRSSNSRSRPSISRSSSNKTSKSRASSSRSKSSRSSSSRGNRSRKLDFFPASSHGGRQIVTSRSVDCAREDKLRVFVSNERLDAARFDGLTLIALDAQGGETPIYIPPNYIEGFRLASSGRIRPQGYQSQGYQSQSYQSQGYPSQGYQSQQPYSGVPVQVQPPSRQIEAAPCPAGTSKQPDGTCLQTSVQGYPYR